jgi:glycosyltransferase involved in cell wall biosynthesis
MTEPVEKSPAQTRTIWVVTELYYPEETSTGYYLTRIAEGLARDGEVRVLCGMPNYSARGAAAPKIERRNGVDVRRISGTTLNKNVIPFRLINMFTLGLGILAASLRRFQKGDQVLVVTTPPALPFVAAVSSLIKGSSFTLLIHDNYPEILIAAGKARPNSALTNLLGRANRWLYKHAARIIVVGRDMQELIARKTAGLDIPIVNIPNWAELETVSPAAREGNPLLRELGLESKFVLLYAGNMGHPNDLETILEAAKGIDSRVHFIFLGSGVKRRWLEDRVQELGLRNVSILDPRPRSNQQVFLNACDIGLVSLIPQMKGVSMPSRTYNIMAAGKPVLAVAEQGSELERVVSEERIGWTVPSGEPGALRSVIESALKSPQELHEMGDRAARAATKKYSLDVAISSYRTELLGAPAGPK